MPDDKNTTIGSYWTPGQTKTDKNDEIIEEARALGIDISLKTMAQLEAEIEEKKSGSSGSSSGSSSSGSSDTSEAYVEKTVIGNIEFGVNDSNNNYIDLQGNRINRVQFAEPAIPLKNCTFSILDLQQQGGNGYKYAYRIPLIYIDDYLIRQVDICDFRLDYNDFLPSLNFDFVDSQNRLLTTNPPRAGSIISIYIGGNGDELYYKPIRQDFIITSIRKIGGGNQNEGDIIKYRVYGKYNIPYGYKKESWDAGTCTAMQALFNIGIWTGLGFATNFTKTNTCDTMNWLNDNTKSLVEFMEEISNHACYSPYTFFTSFVDQYNILNFIECHSLLSHGGWRDEIPAIIYRSLPETNIPDEFGEKTPYNQLPIEPWADKEKEDKDPHYLNNQYQKISYYYITNNDKFDGWSNYIKGYYEINNFVSDGCKTTVEYDNSSNHIQFTIRPIDNLERDNDGDIKSYPIEKDNKGKIIHKYPSQSAYIPINLIQTTNEDYTKYGGSFRDDPTNMESFNNFGEVDTTNMFEQYFFAEVQNKYQMNMMKKCGLHITLQNYNPAITKYSRIWVDIYDKDMNSSLKRKHIFKNDTDSKTFTEYDGQEGIIPGSKDYKKKYNENLLTFNNEERPDPDIEKPDEDDTGTYNRGLSGWYVITGMEIVYDPDDNNLNMELTLNRIEKKPMFRSEYDMAVDGIEKYKEELKLKNN